MRVWVTRSQPGADRTAGSLASLGHEPVVAPVLEIERLPVAPPPLEAATALAFTSAVGVQAFADLTSARDLPVFAVGEATARAARAAGWRDVRSADGDGAALARLIAEASTAAGLPPAGRSAPVVLAPGALEPAFDLAAALAVWGVSTRALPLYAALAAPSPPPQAAAAVAQGRLDGVLVHSPAAARALAGYAAADPVFAAGFATLRPFTLSQACAAPLPAACAPATWPDAPRERDLLALLPLGARPGLR